MDKTDLTNPLVYLQSDFDPTKLNMAQLRNVLSSHDVDYNQAKKKADLVDLFRENISAKAPELLKKQERVAPYLGDIEDATIKRLTRRSRSNTPDTSIHRVSKAPKSARKPTRMSSNNDQLQDDMSFSSVATSNAEDSDAESTAKPTPAKRRTRKLNQYPIGLDKIDDISTVHGSTRKTPVPRSSEPTPLKKPTVHRITHNTPPVDMDNDLDFDSDTTTKSSRRKGRSHKQNGDESFDSELDLGETTAGNISTRSNKSSGSNLHTSGRASKSLSYAVKSPKNSKFTKIPSKANTESTSSVAENAEKNNSDLDVSKDGSDLDEFIAKKYQSIKNNGKPVKKAFTSLSPDIQDENQDPNDPAFKPIKSSTPNTSYKASRPSSNSATPSTASKGNMDSAQLSSATPSKSTVGKTTEISPFSTRNYFQSNIKNSPFSKKRKASEDTQKTDLPSKKRGSLLSKEIMNDFFTKNNEKKPEKEISFEQVGEGENAPITPFIEVEFDQESLITPVSKPLNTVAPRTAPPLRSSGYLNGALPVDSPTLPYSTGKIGLSKKDKSARINFASGFDQKKDGNIGDLDSSLSTNDSLNSSKGKIKTKTEKNGGSAKRHFKPPRKSLRDEADTSRTDIKIEDDNESEKLADLQKEMDEDVKDSEVEEIGKDEPKSKNKKFDGLTFLQLLTICLSLLSLGGFSKWYVTSKVEAGYCDVGFDSQYNYRQNIQRRYRPVHSPETLQEYFEKDYLLEKWDQVQDKWAEVVEEIRPKCEPCPEHAICQPNFNLVCEEGYIKLDSPWSLGGFLPVAPKCILDTGKQKRVEKVVQKALRLIEERKARHVCGYKDCTTEEYEEEELRKALYSMKANSISDEQFDDLWKHALNEIERSEDIIVRQDDSNHEKHDLSTNGKLNSDDTNNVKEDGDDQDQRNSIETVLGNRVIRRKIEEKAPTQIPKYLKTTKLTRVPLGCAIRRAIRQFVARYILYVELILGITFIGYQATRYKQAQDRRIAHAEELAKEVIVSLKAQIQRSKQDERGLTMSCVAVGHLRDELQHDVLDLKKRKKVWEDVQKIVESNVNVRSKQTDVRGEIMKVWEWVGPEF